MKQRFSSTADGNGRPSPDAPSTNGQGAGASSGLAILLIDDNPHIAESLALAVRLAGHGLDRVDGPEAALSRLATRRYDAILLDMNYAAGRTDGTEGLALLSRILADDPAARVVVITAHSGIRIAVEAMRAGACDFVMKPWRNADLLAKIAAAVVRTPPSTPPAGPAATAEPARLIGESAAMVRVRDMIRRIGPTMAGVVVTGASGSGRTLVATALHAASAQAGTPPTRIDLRDADAWSRIDGARGTLLLRHPDRLGVVEQARLLDRLPDGVRPVAIADDPAAIGPALARRIATVAIVVPPLAERGDDVLSLARHFARVAAERHGRAVPRLTPAAESAILHAAWPDEVRGLAAAVERAVLLGDDDTIDAALLLPPPTLPAATVAGGAASARFDLEENERAVIAAALREHHHNVTHAATALGLSRGALYRRMERYGF